MPMTCAKVIKTSVNTGFSCEMNWGKMAIVCENAWYATGLIHLLNGIGEGYLAFFTRHPSDAVLSNYDMVIWVQERFDQQSEIFDLSLKLKKVQPLIRQLIISDYLPSGLTQMHKSIHGILIAKGQDDIKNIVRKIKQLISGKAVPHLSLEEMLSPRQWWVINLLAIGANSHEIAKITNTTVKNVLANRMEIVKLLGLRNRLELAMVLRYVL